MNYTLDSDTREKLITSEKEEERVVYTLEDFRNLKSADEVTVIIKDFPDLALLEAYHNSIIEYYEEEVPVNENLRFDVIIGDFDMRETAYKYALDWNFPTRYEHPPTTEVYQAPVFDETQLTKAVQAEEFVVPANVPAVVSRTKFHVVNADYRKYPDSPITLPRRATKGSAGYDFFSPADFTIEPGEVVLIYSDVKCEFEDPSLYLAIHLRSNVGIKRKLRLANGKGIIDSDYFENDKNDGNIIMAVYNYGTTTRHIEEGEAFAQGVIQRYYLTADDSVSETRNGGIGSTGR